MVENKNQIIICQLGCIGYHVTPKGDYCFQGLFPIAVCEGSRCVRGYTRENMESNTQKRTARR